MHIGRFSFISSIVLFLFFHIHSSIDFLLLFAIPYRLDICLHSLFSISFTYCSLILPLFSFPSICLHVIAISLSLRISFNHYTRFLLSDTCLIVCQLYGDLNFTVSLFHYIYIHRSVPIYAVRSTLHFAIFLSSLRRCNL